MVAWDGNLLGAKPSTKIDNPTADLEARRSWRRFQQFRQPPENDQRTLFRRLGTVSKTSNVGKGEGEVAQA